MSWTTTTLGEVTDLKRGFDLPASKRVSGKYPVYSSSGKTGTHDKYMVEGPCVITGRYGTIGKVFYSSNSCWPLNTSLYSCDFKGNNPRFVYYLLQTIPWSEYKTASAVPGVNRNHVNLHKVTIPDKITQDRIAYLLDSITSKIELNNQINGYLEELVLAQFKALEQTGDWKCARADELFEIGIGKTPPRKESEWFSSNPVGNFVWLSIKDMGELGAYSFDSSEYLTPQAVKDKKIRRVPKGSVLLSFKLTVGRVKIAAVDMTTNEAIAFFASNDPAKLAYLYPFLLTFDYGRLGSTSSIATAINSKTVKAMTITMPDDDTLARFYANVKPLYEMIMSNQRENAFLKSLRDDLLPRLMSGEIDVSKVDLTQLNSHLSGC